MLYVCRDRFPANHALETTLVQCERVAGLETNDEFHRFATDQQIAYGKCFLGAVVEDPNVNSAKQMLKNFAHGTLTRRGFSFEHGHDLPVVFAPGHGAYRKKQPSELHVDPFANLFVFFFVVPSQILVVENALKARCFKIVPVIVFEPVHARLVAPLLVVQVRGTATIHTCDHGTRIILPPSIDDTGRHVEFLLPLGNTFPVARLLLLQTIALDVARHGLSTITTDSILHVIRKLIVRRTIHSVTDTPYPTGAALGPVSHAIQFVPRGYEFGGHEIFRGTP